MSDQPKPEPQPDTPEGRDRKVTVHPIRRHFGAIKRDRRKTAAFESIAADLRRIADKYIGTTGEAPPVPDGWYFHCPNGDGGKLIPEGPNGLSKCHLCGSVYSPPSDPAPKLTAEGFPIPIPIEDAGEPAADSLRFRERFELYTDPVSTYGKGTGINLHPFQKVFGNRFCGECGGGRLHAIHSAPTSLASLHSVISDWNEAFPRGTAVTVKMPDGTKLSTTVASEAFEVRQVPCVFVQDLPYSVRLSQVMPESKPNA